MGAVWSLPSPSVQELPQPWSMAWKCPFLYQLGGLQQHPATDVQPTQPAGSAPLPEQPNAFSLFPVKKVECCGSGNFLELQIAVKGSAALALQQCSIYQPGNDSRNMFVINV